MLPDLWAVTSRDTHTHTHTHTHTRAWKLSRLSASIKLPAFRQVASTNISVDIKICIKLYVRKRKKRNKLWTQYITNGSKMCDIFLYVWNLIFSFFLSSCNFTRNDTETSGTTTEWHELCWVSTQYNNSLRCWIIARKISVSSVVGTDHYRRPILHEIRTSIN